MKTQNITIEFPSDILLTLNENEKELERDIKIAFALRLYKLEELTYEDVSSDIQKLK